MVERGGNFVCRHRLCFDRHYAAKSQLSDMRGVQRVAKQNGRALILAAFVIAKDEAEDQNISTLLNGDLLPRRQFAFIPRLRSISVERGKLVFTSKRDARQYFHMLRMGRKWAPCGRMGSRAH